MMDLLAIIQNRINAKLTTASISGNHGTGREPADTHDAYDAFSEAVLDVARNAPPPANKNKYVIPESNQSSNVDSTPTKIMQPPVNVKAVWPPEDQVLVDWFMIQEAPVAPFYLEPHLRVVAPGKFFESLRREIETGPEGPRARMGSLQSDLWKLKTYLN